MHLRMPFGVHLRLEVQNSDLCPPFSHRMLPPGKVNFQWSLFAILYMVISIALLAGLAIQKHAHWLVFIAVVAAVVARS